jgi:hypothetical protein
MTAQSMYPPGAAGTASDGFRIPQPRTPADPTATPQPAGGAHNEKGNKP